MLEVLGENSVKVLFFLLFVVFLAPQRCFCRNVPLVFWVENENKVVDLNSDVKMEHPIPDRVRAVEVIHCFVLF